MVRRLLVFLWQNIFNSIVVSIAIIFERETLMDLDILIYSLWIPERYPFWFAACSKAAKFDSVLCALLNPATKVSDCSNAIAVLSVVIVFKKEIPIDLSALIYFLLVENLSFSTCCLHSANLTRLRAMYRELPLSLRAPHHTGSIGMIRLSTSAAGDRPDGNKTFSVENPPTILGCWVIKMLFNAAQMCLLPWQFAGCWRYLWWLEGSHSCICSHHVLKTTERERACIEFIGIHQSLFFRYSLWLPVSCSGRHQGGAENPARSYPYSQKATSSCSTYCFPLDECFLRSEKKLLIRKAPKNFEQVDDVQRCRNSLITLKIREPFAISLSYYGVICYHHALKLIEAEETYFGASARTPMKIFFQMQFTETRVMPREILDVLVKDLCPNAYGHINAFNSEFLTYRDILSVGAKALHYSKGLGCQIQLWRLSDDRGLRMKSR